MGFSDVDCTRLPRPPRSGEARNDRLFGGDGNLIRTGKN